MASQIATPSRNKIAKQSSTSLTFMEHIQELQGRLFSIALSFVVLAGLAYPFFDKITELIMAPLDEGQELVYLTPAGAFSFIIKVCAYVGIIGSLPIIIYHLYRFIMPAVAPVKLRQVLKYTLSSLILGIVGILFAYFVSLPAALHFLTNFDLVGINPMLTIDSYFSFVMTYLLAGALLFQLPVIMMISNNVTPLTPRKLMNYQRHVIVGSFVVAAVISPTPDALNQTLLASPVVVMYQLGIVLVWLVNRKKQVKTKPGAVKDLSKFASSPDSTLPVATSKPKATPTIASPVKTNQRSLVVPARPGTRALDMVVQSPLIASRRQQQRLQSVRPQPRLQTGRRIDGISASPAVSHSTSVSEPKTSNLKLARYISSSNQASHQTIDGIIATPRVEKV